MTDKIECIDKLPLRGMRDFLPKDWIFRAKLMRAWTEAAAEAGFVRYETPIVEPLALLERKSGEEISDQIYNFEDKSGRKIALRPEITPSMVRIVSGNRDAFPAQGKVYAIGQCFRYERASLGRKREHFQWNIDIVGTETTAAEAYLLKTAVVALQKLGFSAADYQIRVNNRQLVSDFLATLGISGDAAAAAMGVMDKKDKIAPADFRAMLADIGVSDKQADALTSFMAAKSLADLESFGLAQSPALADMKRFLSHCAALGISEYVAIDTGIVRGLVYYTGIVFEAFDTRRKFRAIFGGGRYDHLFEKLTGKPAAAVGLGFGDVVIEELYKDKFADRLSDAGVDILIGCGDDAAVDDALAAFRAVAGEGLAAECDFKPAPLGKFLARANKRGAHIAGYIGDQERAAGEILFKNMATGKQIAVKTADKMLSARLKQLLGE
ncbi:MAG: histidine--tRNA ligase [Alphaproteobacteria bacterium]|nr:histidine--tRNA ligase [Alphaproteobacteria bacterium]